MISLVNKTFFITGLGSGIGLATGQLLTSYGAQVAGTILDKTQAAATAEFCDHSYVLDVTDTASLAAAVQDVTTKSGNLDGVIGGAGIIELKTSSDTSSQQWHKMIDVNLSANFELAKIASQHLGADSAMVFISSQIGLVGHKNAAAYAASKAGLNGLTRSLALELADRNIRVNAIAPGPIATPMTANTMAAPERYQELVSKIPLGRFGEAKEIARLAAFLIGDTASFITGQVIVADGGFTAQ
jgi:NAD(P)-dependent dehydrogenase (short-subunit alcohol dehydrogenase family)